MSNAAVSIDGLITAFGLPPGPQPRRVPKASLSDNVPTPGDKRLIESKLARLEWIAAINPATASIAAATADGMEISTINLLAAYTRGPMPPRLAELIHRAIPQPVILIHGEDVADAPASLSLAPKRAAERDAGRVVVTALHDSGPLHADDRTFLDTLAVTRLPSRDLHALYTGLIERIEALAAARNGKRPFRLATSSDQTACWREAVAQTREIEAQISSIAATMRKETRLAARVESGEKVQQLRHALDKYIAMLK